MKIMIMVMTTPLLIWPTGIQLAAQGNIITILLELVHTALILNCVPRNIHYFLYVAVIYIIVQVPSIINQIWSIIYSIWVSYTDKKLSANEQHKT